MSDPFAEFRGEAPTNIMEEVGAMARLQMQRKREMDAAAAALAKATAAYESVSKKMFPELMKKTGGLNNFDVDIGGGRKVVVNLDETPHAKMSEAQRDVVLNWMKEHGYSHMITSDFVVPFTKGQEKEADAFKEVLKEAKVKFAQKEDVHSSRYTSMVKQALKDGEIPLEQYPAFGIHIQPVVKLTLK